MELTGSALMVLQLLYFAALGFPVSHWLSKEFRGDLVIGIYAGAPLMGVFISLWIGVVAFKFCLNQGHVAIGLLGAALLASTVIFAINRKSYRPNRSSIKTSIIIISIVLLTIFMYSLDFDIVGTHNYFPRTNDDTFSYLGQIDQLRTVKTMLPQMEYPAGYRPAYLHAINIRGAVAALVAGQAELFGLETHAAFFSVIRTTIPLAVIGICSMLLTFGSGTFAAIMGTLLFSGGNFMLHQVFQQFLSSSFGVVCAIGLLILTGIAIYREYRLINIGVAGMSAGIFAMASPEAHLFLLIGLCVVFIIIHIGKTISQLIQIIICFALGFIIGSMPLLPNIYIDVFNQAHNALQGHPGDWIAQVGYIVQASGVKFFTGQALFESIIDMIAALFIMAVTIIGTFYLIVVPRLSFERIFYNYDLFRLVGWTSFVALASVALFFLAGKGYSMLKSFDYYCFYPAVVFGVCVGHIQSYRLFTQEAKFQILFKSIIVFIVFAFLLVTISHKRSEIMKYVKNVKKGPLLGAYYYKMPENDAVTGVAVDLYGFPLNLFLYVNRLRSVPVFLEPGMSNRYIPALGKEVHVSHVFRMGYLGTADSSFIDINRPRVPVLSEKAELMDARAYLKLISDSGWLRAEGDRPEVQFRWLSGTGKFEVLKLSEVEEPKLYISIRPGPDILPKNIVEVTLDGRILKALDAKQLPVDLVIPLSDNSNVG
ncbi:MAG TPA: hypothetical protein VLX29_06020, partial [Nitrospirota bacterium]|nr:hypothetical protein [Nitrospirota bacterium]